jgi:hypothetical protein
MCPYFYEDGSKYVFAGSSLSVRGQKEFCFGRMDNGGSVHDRMRDG